MPRYKEDYDKLFCIYAKKNGLKKLFLKAVGIVESNLNPEAKRFEQGFWDRYLKDHSHWKDKDPQEVSSSWGLMQLMYVTAWEQCGFRGRSKDLTDPAVSIALGAKLLKRNLVSYNYLRHPHLIPLKVALAQYNGGRWKNPSNDGKLRNNSYVKKVYKVWKELKTISEECTQ